MKRILIMVVIVFLIMVSQVFAAWTIDISVTDVKGNYVIYKVLCTSNGDALPATDIVALMNTEEYEYIKAGAVGLVLSVSPGAGGVAPDTEIDIVFTDINGVTVFDEADFSYTEDTSGVPLWWDWWSYPVITTKFYLALNDIGADGDQVTLYLLCYSGKGKGGIW